MTPDELEECLSWTEDPVCPTCPNKLIEVPMTSYTDQFANASSGEASTEAIWSLNGIYLEGPHASFSFSDASLAAAESQVTIMFYYRANYPDPTNP